ncbi:MAG: hypothetical protein CMC74_10765 [Flavobacteriaceae bacterium]|nr:hypothetical protein [Flavobacteriaceae bacterium]|tara:strand:- start:40475 stop:42319 length:1845 start_codon:yes stop_codon:yes gene_type:complete
MNRFFRFYIYFILGFSCHAIEAQTNLIDSLINNFEFEKAHHYISQNYEDESEKNLKFLQLYSEKKQLDSAYYYFYKIDTSSFKTLQKADYYFYQAQIEEASNNEDIALPLYKKAQVLYQKENDVRKFNQINYEFYATITSQKQYDYPKQGYLDQFIVIAKRNDFPNQLANGYLEKALQHMNPLDKDSVSFYFKKASKNAFKVRDPLLISRVYAFKGLYHTEILQQLDSADHYYQKESEWLSKRNTDYRGLYNYINKANVERKRGNTSKAISLLLKADSIPHTLYRKNNKIFLYRLLMKDYESIGKPLEALKYSKLAALYRDSINVAAQNVNLTRFQANEKEKQILLEQQQKEQNLNIAYGLGGASILMGFIGFLTFKNAKKKQRIAEQEKLLEKRAKETLLKDQEIHIINAMMEGQEKERQRLAGDLHDSIGATLSAAKLQFDHLYKQNKDASHTKELFSKTKTLLEEAYQEVRSMAHLKNSGVIAKNGLLPAVERLAKNASTKSLVFEVQSFGLDQRLDNQKEIALFRMIQELVTNIIKHSEATEASISLTQREDILSVIIEDNGKGFNSRKIKREEGLGLNSIEKRIEHWDGSMEIDSTPGNGTNVIIEIPI